ncbi:hypothetical protein DFAR_2770042 [Desulfarculales bacterium]
MPQGRGKVERFFCTVRSQFFPGFKNDTLRDINEALEYWIRDVYHQRKHLGTGQASLHRFTSKIECVRPVHADLEGYFRKRAARHVPLDRTVFLAGRLYEAPAPLIGKQIIFLYHDYDPDHVEVLLEDRFHGLLRGSWTSPSIAGSSATTICCAWNPAPPQPPLATPFSRKTRPGGQ